MKQRTITAFFFVIAMMAGIFGGVAPFFILFGLIGVGILWELNELLIPIGEQQRTLRKVVGVGFGILPYFIVVRNGLSQSIWSGGAYMQQSLLIDNAVLYFIVGLIPLIFLFELYLESEKPFANLSTYCLGFLYVGLPLCLLVALSVSPNYHPFRVLGILLLIWTNDTMAYLIGSKIGRTKLLERISPKKTWEGTLGGTLCTVGMGWAMAHYFPNDFTMQQWLWIGAVVGIFGTLGDLVESMLKRSVGVKDSGNLLPGHGGLLDRFDSFVFVVPLIWLVLQFLGF